MLAVYGRKRRLGTIELRDGKLYGSSPAIQEIADTVLRRTGVADAAYRELALLNNGYVRIIETDDTAQMTAKPANEAPKPAKTAEPVHFKGPGQWRSQAAEVQEGEPAEEDEGEGEDSPAALAAVKPYTRIEHGRVEHVGEYVTRKPKGWIPEAKWREGQQEWVTKGETGSKPVKEPIDSLQKYTRPDGSLDPARAALDQKIIDTMLAGHQPQQHPEAVFYGGGPASGKSMLTEAPDSVHIDADQVKTMLPDYQQMMKAGDSRAAAYVHEESSKISKDALAAALNQHLNITLDGTGDGSYAKLAHRVAEVRAAGYPVTAKYVTADTATAVDRAAKRARQTGRAVPETVIRSIHANVSRIFPDAVEKHLFDGVELWDNNGTKPVLIASQPPGSEFRVLDQAAYDRFLDKGMGSTEKQASAAERGSGEKD